MATISMGPAISSGLQLIARRPWAMLAWGFAYLMIAVVPQFLMIGVFLPDLVAFYRDTLQATAAGQAPAQTAEMAKIQAELARYQPVQILTSILATAVVNAAIYRAILEPENKAYAYLRFGAQELWVGLVNIVFYFLIFLAVLAAVVPLVILIGVGAAAGARTGWTEGLVAFLLACGAAAAVIWVALRLSLALPLSFSQRAFRLFESWDMTRGQGWRLFGVAMAVFGIILALEIVIFGLAGALGASAAISNLKGLKAFMEHPPSDWLMRAAPWILIGGGFYVVLMGVVLTTINAPFATIMKQLSPPDVSDTF
jgi:hypothetical protein